MKSVLPLLTLALVFASCSTAYKSGQTPDDVYYSPARPQDEYVRQEKKDDRQYRYDEQAYRDDRYLRMKIRDRRYADLYDDYYSYNPYYYHYYNGALVYNSPFSSYTYWNYYYNPYCHHVVTGVSGTPRPIYSKPRQFDLSVYNPQPTGSSYSHNGPRTYSYPSTNNSSNTESYRGSEKNAGSFLRDVFGGGSSGSSSSSGSSTPKSGSSSSSSSSSGSSGSTNAPARKF